MDLQTSSLTQTSLDEITMRSHCCLGSLQTRGRQSCLARLDTVFLLKAVSGEGQQASHELPVSVRILWELPLHGPEQLDTLPQQLIEILSGEVFQLLGGDLKSRVGVFWHSRSFSPFISQQSW